MIDRKQKILYNILKGGYKINYSLKKNQLLKETRGVCFEDVIGVLSLRNLVAVIENPNTKDYPDQYILLVRMDDYIHVVPFLTDKENKQYFLKTVYPSRKYTKIYL